MTSFRINTPCIVATSSLLISAVTQRSINTLLRVFPSLSSARSRYVYSPTGPKPIQQCLLRFDPVHKSAPSDHCFTIMKRAVCRGLVRPQSVVALLCSTSVGQVTDHRPSTIDEAYEVNGINVSRFVVLLETWKSDVARTRQRFAQRPVADRFTRSLCHRHCAMPLDGVVAEAARAPAASPFCELQWHAGL